MVRNTRKPLKNFAEIKAECLKRPEVKAAYDALEDEFDLMQEIITVKKRIKKTQAQIAEEMGTHASAVNRLELSLGNGKHSPSLNTLRKYAKALGCKLEIRLKPLPKEK
ncbi:MAG TPA: helix-turn-helix transcriptional regulator [Coxiellaceae bacterium]|nr:helix-turn-helix transcriptional regulator [Coxiellaceae bacterium]